MTSDQSTPALFSWSGGKDSCLALWRARQSGMTIQRLITALDDKGESSRSHGIPPELIQAQAEALGAEMRFYQTNWKNYEEKFIATLRDAHADGFRHAVFGDIDLVPHREWEEKVCARAGVTPNLPLWGEPRQRLVDEFLGLGFKAVVVCVNGSFLGREFAGREFDQAFLSDLPASVDACGENGEFHTFVYDGPGFAKPVVFNRGEVVQYVSPAEYGGTTYYFQKIIPVPL